MVHIFKEHLQTQLNHAKMLSVCFLLRSDKAGKSNFFPLCQLNDFSGKEENTQSSYLKCQSGFLYPCTCTFPSFPGKSGTSESTLPGCYDESFAFGECFKY